MMPLSSGQFQRSLVLKSSSFSKIEISFLGTANNKGPKSYARMLPNGIKMAHKDHKTQFEIGLSWIGQSS